ncbi:hypothetical protein PR003_g26064 [Phytophthora rubi]|uniref:RxLR effector protein n=1 Tax=Phytophthora rubi TaxID=129364 RepID=A0A6A4C9B7_9STRA|nr:hypothetical protein PR001_g25207 [Phytophthora rubi]KAE9287388.1 hypothetical protein PR003_g26064 [Phytophthora rubi]
MRLQLAVLLAVATFLASVTAAVDSKAAAVRAVVRNGVPATRLLRTGTTTEEDDEERGIPLPGLESLTRSNSQKQLDELVESGLGSINSFAALKLDNAGKPFSVAPNSMCG